MPVTKTIMTTDTDDGAQITRDRLFKRRGKRYKQKFQQAEQKKYPRAPKGHHEEELEEMEDFFNEMTVPPLMPRDRKNLSAE
ncbi:hypothetical protein OESDEN_16693 [Oesophagostomum dentatum]|uniref:Uncharacterized protein n=1 Tax=Oesophagostomum dentatum TaxID=61180 RepID=A0A0B1SI98_OESDE|nr:hypothetical protein OESDEN_16693 [Oesophagostomum dentatum]